VEISKNNKLGFLVKEFGASQLGYLLARNINQYSRDDCTTDIIVYYENLHKNPVTPSFGIMQIAEAWNQQGVFVATDISTALKLSKFTGTKHKFFYVWDLEWTRGQNRPYNIFKSVYKNNDIKLIARCESHKIAIESSFNTKVYAVIDDFNMGDFIEKVMKNE
jgi:hypothetical protein